jgi:hypothetical protein
VQRSGEDYSQTLIIAVTVVPHEEAWTDGHRTNGETLRASASHLADMLQAIWQFSLGLRKNRLIEREKTCRRVRCKVGSF